MLPIILCWTSIALLVVGLVALVCTHLRLTNALERIEHIEENRDVIAVHGISDDATHLKNLQAPVLNAAYLDILRPVDAQICVYDVDMADYISAMIHIKSGSQTRIVPTVVFQTKTGYENAIGSVQHSNIWSSIVCAYRLFLNEKPEFKMIAVAWMDDNDTVDSHAVFNAEITRDGDMEMACFLLSARDTNPTSPITIQPFMVTYPHRTDINTISGRYESMLGPTGIIVPFNEAGEAPSIASIITAMRIAADNGRKLTYHIYTNAWSNPLDNL